MDNIISSETLVNALEIYQQKHFKEYEKLEKLTPSKSFEKRMTKLIKSQSNFYYKATLTNVRKTAVIIAAAVVILASAMSVGAIREKVLGFFISSKSGVDVIEYDKNNSSTYPKTLEKRFTLSYVPKGYKAEDISFDETGAEEYYVSNEDKYIDFQQFIKEDYSSASDEEFSPPEKVSYNGQDYIIRKSEDMFMLVWEKNGYVFEMTGFEKLNEMYKIAESAKEAEEE